MRNPIIEEDLKNIIRAKLPWQKFYGSTVLVSGANGMLPAYMVETLLYLNEKNPKAKIEVVGLVRNKAAAFKRFSFYRNRGDLKLVVADVSKPFSIPGKVDYIIHAASQASPKFYGTDPVGTILPNVLGTYQLLELARKKKIQNMIFFSSGEVYGKVNTSIVGENDYGYLDPTQVRSCYGESKRLGETLCVSYFHQYRVPVKIARISHTYGPGMKLNDGRVFADFVADVVQDRDLVLNSDGKAMRPFCYITDATEAFFTLLLKGENGQAYNVGNDKQEISILALANILASLFPEKHLKVIKNVKPQPAGYLQSRTIKSSPDVRKIKRLGWQPHTTVREGFTRTINSFLYE
jgi:nucleoside-diphosphate-sugar epimerase